MPRTAKPAPTFDDLIQKAPEPFQTALAQLEFATGVNGIAARL